MRVLCVACIFVLLAVCTVSAHRNNVRYLREQGGAGGGGGGGAGSNEGPGQNGGNGGGVGGGEGGQGGWGGPVSEGTDEECIDIAKQRCPLDGSPSPILPNPNDCGSFCVCSAGIGKFIPCAGGLYFSETLQACTWPWEANCQYEEVK